jgi:hypothetical protein
MKVIRQVCYEGPEDKLREQLARSMPEGLRPGMKGVTIDVRTVYSDLPVLEPFVPLEETEPPVGGYISTADAEALVLGMMEPEPR